MKNKLIYFVPLIFLVMFSIWFKSNFRQSKMYVIPYGYTGWIRVKYDVVGAPILPRNNGYIMLYIPENGVLLTSSSLDEGWGADKYYQLDARGQKRALPPSHKEEKKPAVWGGSINGSQMKFFVGSKEQFYTPEQ